MSTKTTFKRIALVAVASLGFGMLSVAPSNAAGMLADTLVNAADGTATVASTATVGGSAATAKIVWSGVATGASDTATVTGTITSIPATSSRFQVTFAATSSITTNVNAVDTVTAGVIVANGAAGRVTKYVTASFTPDVAGTYVIALKASGGVNNQTITWTITAAATPAATAAASSVVFYSKAVNGGGGAPGTEPNIQDDYIYARYTLGQTLDDALTTLAAGTPASGVFLEPVTAASSGSIVGSGMVHFSNKTVIAANSAVAVPLTVTTTRGYVRVSSVGGDTPWGTSVTETTAAGFTPFESPADFGRMKFFKVMSDGTTGPATITVSAAGVTLGTVSMVFTGAKASLALATGTATKLSKSYIGSGETATVTINGLDASGNILSTSGITAVTGTDATSAIATAAINGNVVTVTGGLVQGAVTWTVTDGTRTVSFVTNTTKKTAKTVTITASNTNPVPGEKVTLTITAKDANGSPVADGARALFGSTGITTNLAVGSSDCPTTATVNLVNGVATCSFFATFTSGTLTVSAKEGAAVDNVVTNGSTAAATISIDLTVANAALDQAQAATDAAAEATDAANAATDAANAAAEAADAATAAAQDAADAVAALSTQVAEMIDALKKQITALTNLVIKIQKKVKA